MATLIVTPGDWSIMVKHGIHYHFVTLGAIFTGLIFVLLGVLSLYVSGLPFLETNPQSRAFLSNLGGVLVATGAISLVWDIFGRRQFAKEVFATAQLSQDIHDSGVDRITTDFNHDVEWKSLLMEARELDLFVAYAGTWRQNNIQHLTALATRKGCRVRLVLPDPDNKWLMGDLAARFNYETGDLESKVRASEKEFRQLFGDDAGNPSRLQIWYSNKAPVLTFYRIDHKYVMTTYRHRGGRGDILTIVCHGKGMVTDFIRAEMDAIMDESGKLARRVFPSPMSPGTFQSNTESPEPEGDSGGI